MLSACASVPETTGPNVGDLAAIDGATPGMQAAAQANHLYGSQQAQLNDIREAEARVDLARARLDFATVRNKGAGDGDVREFLDARRSLRQLRNVYGPTDTGRPSWGYRPYYEYGTGWPRRRRGYGVNYPTGTFGKQITTRPTSGQAMPLSGQSGSGHSGN
jgi:hypothetical protein